MQASEVVKKMEEERTFNIDIEDEGERVDKFLAGKNEEMSRSYLQKLIDRDLVKVNGESVKSSYIIQPGDMIKLIIPPPEEPDIKPVEMDLDIIYEDEDIIIVNKQPGRIVHPVPGNREKTMVNGLLAYTDDLAGIAGVRRPGIVHRLDRDTSGVLVVAKNDQAHRNLVNQFKNRDTKKIYQTVVKGKFPYKVGEIDAPIGRDPEHRTRMAVTEKNSKRAVTLFKVLQYYQDYTYLEVELKTGRTHQIRVHFSHLGHPVVGDKKYDGQTEDVLQVERQLLHAYILGFNHPGTGEWVEFKAELPRDFEDVLVKLENSLNGPDSCPGSF